MKPKLHIPMRSCVSCRRKDTKSTFLKVVSTKTPNGLKCSIDRLLELPGRGSYICSSKKCIELARKKNRFNRTLKSEIDRSIYDKLLGLCEN